jgi:hypothetical protein
MAGEGMVLTERDRAILQLAAELGPVSRAQFERFGHFGSRTRANAVLGRLVRFSYLAVRRQPLVGGSRRLLYHLGRRGEDLLAVNGRRKRVKELSDLFLEHHLRTTDVRLAFPVTDDGDCILDRWLTDHELRTSRLGVIPDAYVEYRYRGLPFAAFVEVDLGTETLTRWEQKVVEYLRLARSGAFTTVCRLRYFRVLVITISMGRVETLQTAIARVTPTIFWLTTFDALAREGALASIWRRPATSSFHSLTQPQ